jgi:predicted enzyme related to lactoylglutathione lyase
MMKMSSELKRLLLTSIFSCAVIISSIDSALAQSNQKLPDCCVKAEKEGKICEYFPQPLKVGALTFKVSYAALFTKDVQRLYEFYRSVLKLDAKDAKEYWSGNDIKKYVEVNTLGAVLSMTYKADVNNNNSSVMLEFGTTENIDSEYARIKALGVKMKENTKNDKEFKFYDPDGNLINFYYDPHIPLRAPFDPNVNSEVIAKKPDCCKEAEFAGAIRDYATQPYRTAMPPNTGSKLYKLGYISIMTRDVNKLYQFYKGILNVKESDVKELWSGNDIKKYVEIPSQLAVLSLTYNPDAELSHNNIMLEIECQNTLSIEYERIQKLNTRIKENSKNYHEFKAYDPDGTELNFFHEALVFYRQHYDWTQKDAINRQLNNEVKNKLSLKN